MKLSDVKNNNKVKKQVYYQGNHQFGNQVVNRVNHQVVNQFYNPLKASINETI